MHTVSVRYSKARYRETERAIGQKGERGWTSEIIRWFVDYVIIINLVSSTVRLR